MHTGYTQAVRLSGDHWAETLGSIYLTAPDPQHGGKRKTGLWSASPHWHAADRDANLMASAQRELAARRIWQIL